MKGRGVSRTKWVSKFSLLKSEKNIHQKSHLSFQMLQAPIYQICDLTFTFSFFFTLLVWFCIRPDFLWASDATAHIDRCLGDPKNIWVDNFERPMENASLTKLHNLCQIAAPPQQDHIQYIVNLIRACTCWIHVGFYYGYASNLFEMVVYCRIFVFMRR